MWQVLLAAAVAGSTGFVANHFLNQTKQCHQNPHDPGSPLDDPVSQPPLVPDGNDCSGSGINSDTQDGIFTFSSSESLRKDGFQSRTSDPRKKPLIRRRQSKDGLKIAKMEHGSGVQVRSSEQSKEGKRLSFCLKRRKTIKNLSGKTGFCTSKDGSLFGWGLGFGIMYMMSAGKSEVTKLNKAMDETAKIVQELKSDLHRRRSTRKLTVLDSVDRIDLNSPKVSGRNEVILKKTSSEVRDTDVRVSSVPAASDDGECGSSALTEESDQRVLGMGQLEAELELELQKLSGCTIDSPYDEGIRPKLQEQELQVEDEGCDRTDSHGVSASELSEKLSHLLIERQENQIAELESELQLAQSKLHEKEAELQALKDSVRRLTQISLSSVSDDETDAGADHKGSSARGSNNMDCESKQSVAGVKRPIDSEACAYYYLK